MKTNIGTRFTLWALCGAMAALVGCVDYRDEADGKVPLSEIPLGRQGTIPLLKGFLDGKGLTYYDFGDFVPSSASWFPSYDKFPGMPVREMYVLSDGGADKGGLLSWDGRQKPIIDTLPLQAKYSDFFQVVKFIPEPEVGYVADDIKSRSTLLFAGYKLEYTGKIVNCPVVGEKAALEGGSVKSLQVWYRNKTVHCMLMEGRGALFSGGTAAPLVYSTKITADRMEYRVAATEVYMLKTSAFSGSDYVANIAVPHNHIFRYGPASAAQYTPLMKIWDVTVPSDYKVGEISSHAQLFPVPDFTDPRIEARNPESFANISIASVQK